MRDEVSIIDLPREPVHHGFPMESMSARSFNDFAIPCELAVVSAEPPFGGAG